MYQDSKKAEMSIELTQAAADRIREQIAARGEGMGLRIGVTTTGCSGNAYKLGYADDIGPRDRVFEAHGARVVVAEQDLPLLENLRVDFRREGLNEMFRFDNPNATGLCGCGESFHYNEQPVT